MANEPAFRVEKFPIGIASVGLGEIERRIPADEPPPLAPNAKLSAIGKPVPRQDARGKVTGATRFTVDLALPGMLYGRILRSTFPHARIRALDLTAAARHPEVRAAVAVAQPGDPVSGVVRYVGAPIAAIAATSIGRGRGGDGADPPRRSAAAVRRRHGGGASAGRPDRSRRSLRSRRPSLGLAFAAGSADRGQRARPRDGQPRRRGAGLGGRRDRRRGRIPHADADPLLPRAARHRRGLARRRPDRLHVDPVHRRRARGAGGGVRPAARTRARRRRRHGRRLRLEVVARQLRARRGRPVAAGRGAGAHRARSR